MKQQSVNLVHANILSSHHYFIQRQSQKFQQQLPAVSQPNNNHTNINNLLEKKRTYSTLIGSNYTYKSYSANSQNQQQDSSLDFPLSSHGDTVSNQARYLSFMDFQHIQQKKRGKQEDNDSQISEDQQRSQMLKILYRSIIYLRKQEMRSEIDDSLLLQQIKPHVKMGLCPESQTQIGHQLFRNGFFLAALAVLKARIHGSYFLLNYLFNYFQTDLQIQDNQFEFKQYSQRDPAEFQIPLHSSIKNISRKTSISNSILKRNPQQISNPIQIKHCQSIDMVQDDVQQNQQDISNQI